MRGLALTAYESGPPVRTRVDERRRTGRAHPGPLRGPFIADVTANLPFGERHKVFPDETTVAAAVGRLVHHRRIRPGSIIASVRPAELPARVPQPFPPIRAGVAVRPSRSHVWNAVEMKRNGSKSCRTGAGQPAAKKRELCTIIRKRH